MPTPKTGVLTMNDINVEIKRGTINGPCSLADVRTRTGFTGAISFSDLRGGEGALITGGVFSLKGVTSYGFNRLTVIGSIDPADSNGYMQIAANSWVSQCFTQNTTPSNTQISLSSVPSTAAGYSNGDSVTTGFKITDVNYVAIGGLSRSIVAAVSNSIFSTMQVAYSMPQANNATSEFFIRFA